MAASGPVGSTQWRVEAAYRSRGPRPGRPRTIDEARVGLLEQTRRAWRSSPAVISSQRRRSDRAMASMRAAIGESRARPPLVERAWPALGEQRHRPLEVDEGGGEPSGGLGQAVDQRPAIGLEHRRGRRAVAARARPAGAPATRRFRRRRRACRPGRAASSRSGQGQDGVEHEAESSSDCGRRRRRRRGGRQGRGRAGPAPRARESSA